MPPVEIVAWPVTVDGQDGSLVANHKKAAAWFAYGSREPFFAVYKPGSRSGLAHYADPAKVFAMGGSAGGLLVETMLRIGAGKARTTRLFSMKSSRVHRPVTSLSKNRTKF